MNFILLDGTGDPNTSSEYKAGVETLFSLAYSVKFLIKKGREAIDYGVLPLEGLWWSEDMSQFSVDRKDDWLWTMLIMQPEIVTQEHIEIACDLIRARKNLPLLDQVRFDSIDEGLSTQILHIGPFADEGPTIARLHEYINSTDYQFAGKHHEI